MTPRHRLLPALLAMSLLSFLAGCVQLPEVTAKAIRYESSYPVGGTSIVVRDVEVTDSEVKAGEYTRTTKIFGVTQSITVEGYRRERRIEAAAKPSPLTP